ncbi:MAG: protease modulator HflC [Nitrospinota bacterium]|nr:protease modulator HflC [Nitrospinota bacterium]
MMSEVKNLVFGILLVVALFLAGSSFYVVQEFEQAVVLRFGKFVTAVSEPGLHTKIPIILQVTKYDKRLLDYDITPTEIVTKDKRTLVVDSFSKWKITDPELFYKRVRTEIKARGRIKDIIYSELWQEFGSHTLEEIVSVNRQVFMENVTMRANQKAEQMEMGIAIIDVRIKRADLPEENKNSVFRRMREERKRIASQFRAEGEEEANKIRANADKEKTVMLAEAYKKEQIIRGEADSVAIKIYADAFKKDPEFYEFQRSLEAYRKALTSNNAVILSDRSEFMKYFNASDEKK